MANGKTQEIIIKSQPKGAICTLTNDLGSWTATAPDTVVIMRSGSDLQVYCASGKAHKAEVIKSGASKAMGRAGLIGDIVDMGIGGAYEYQSVIDIKVR